MTTSLIISTRPVDSPVCREAKESLVASLLIVAAYSPLFASALGYGVTGRHI